MTLKSCGRYPLSLRRNTLVEGRASLIHDKAQFAVHWPKDLDRWFPQGIDTPGLTLIKVHAGRVHYWDGGDEGEVSS